MIIEGSTVFSNTGYLGEELKVSRVSNGYIPNRANKKIDSKDITSQANVYKNKKGHFF